MIKGKQHAGLAGFLFLVAISAVALGAFNVGQDWRLAYVGLAAAVLGSLWAVGRAAGSKLVQWSWKQPRRGTSEMPGWAVASIGVGACAGPLLAARISPSGGVLLAMAGLLVFVAGMHPAVARYADDVRRSGQSGDV
jgi:hypothetical protein